VVVESVDQVVERLKQQKIKDWEVYFQKPVSHQIFLRRNETELIQSTDTVGYGIRIYNKGLGFNSSNIIKPGVIDASIKDVSSLARISKKVKFQFPSSQKTKKVKIVDRSLEKENAENTLLEFSSQLVDLVKEKDIEISFAKLKAFDIMTEIVNSEGLEKTKNETYFFLELSLKAEREFWTSRYTRRIKDLSIETITEWIDLAKKVSIAVEPKVEKTSVIFTPNVMVDAIVPVMGFHCVASSLKRKISFFLHSKQFSKDITVADDGLYPFGLMTSSFDDEGNPQKKNTVIEKGVFKNYLSDQLYANILNRKSTGNGLRQRPIYPLIDDRYTSQPHNQTSNPMILPGKKSLNNLISETDKGIIVYAFSWLDPNEETGTFSSEIRNAAYIENGEITKPIKGGIVSGNVFDLLKNVSCISKEFEITSGATAFSGIMPYIRFENVQIAGRN
jgi:predicted Zn-dependent protease